MRFLPDFDKTSHRNDWGVGLYYPVKSLGGKAYPFGWSPDNCDASRGFRLCREVR